MENPYTRSDPQLDALSSTDGRRLRSCRRALSIVIGAVSHRRGPYFLGWTYHFQGASTTLSPNAKRAIELRSGIRQSVPRHWRLSHRTGRFDEAIPWLERAVEARRYEPRHFPHYNLGRAYLGKEMYGQAMRCFQEALNVEPRYSLARQALASLRRLVN